MIRYSEENGVARIGFDSRYNALNLETIGQFMAILDTLRLSDKIKVVVIYGVGGRFFCTGANPDEIKQCKTVADFCDFCRFFTDILYKIEALPQMTVAKISGKSAGSGVAIACACDINFALAGSLFRMSEVLFGFDPMIVIDPLIKKMRVGFTQQMILNPQTFFDSDWALKSGMLDYVSPASEKLDNDIHQKICEFLHYSPPAIQLWKKNNIFMSTANVTTERIQVTAETMADVFSN